jgi:hypothetical protein
MRTICLWVACLALAACQSSKNENWVSDRIPARTERHLWDVLIMSVRQARFSIALGTQPSDRTIETGWLIDTAPFKGEGWRKKAHLRYAPVEGVEGEWNVDVRVEMETNESFRSLDLRYADWQPAPDDEAAARRVLQTARSLLGPREFELAPKGPPLDSEFTPEP